MLSKIFGIICVIQCAAVNHKITQTYFPPDRIQLRLKYDEFHISKFKYGDSTWITPQTENIHLFVNGIKPCTRYDIKAVIIADKVVEMDYNDYYITDIGMQPIATVTPALNSITIKLNFNNFDCIKNLSVIIDNSREIVYTTFNITSSLIIPDLQSCANYSTIISLNHQSGHVNLYNGHIRINPMKLRSVENITYNSEKWLLMWSSDQSGNCSTTYDIIIKSDNESKLHRTMRNDYDLHLLNACSKYQVSITPTGHDELKRTISFETGYKRLSPKPPSLHTTTTCSLVIKTEYIADKCGIEMFQFECYNKQFNIKRFIFDENGIGIITNLKSGAPYSCTAKVKNGAGWSKPSSYALFKTRKYEKYPAIELYSHSVSSKAIYISWNTSLMNFEIRIQKADDSNVLPPHRVQIKNKTEHIFNNLEPYTNYSIRAADKVQIFVTTDPDVPYQVKNLKIVNQTSHSVTISFEMPCTKNGRVKSFVGKFHIIKPSDVERSHFAWNLPFDNTQNVHHTFFYTENRILPRHTYNITVGIKIYNFVGSLNESAIEFTSLSEESKSNQIEAGINTTSSGTSLIWYIVGIIICIALVATSGGGLWYYRIGKYQITSPLNSTYIEVKYFLSCYNKSDPDCIANEFYSIENIDLSTIGKECAAKYRTKNRYLDITPYDYNRVILTPNMYCTSDYINASYIDGYKHKNQYIATQGPKEQTVYDFWHMVIEKKCNKIVMLTQTRENNMPKCFQYFPLDKEKLKFGDLTIRNMVETDFQNFIRRELVIGKGLALRSVIHYQYVTWPDRDCPKNELDVLEFIEFTKSSDNKASNPMIVHCSAGVGRTGTFIALDILLQRVRHDNFFSIFETIKKLRLQRCGMVQTVGQYQFVYAAISKYYLRRAYKGKE